MANMMPNLNVQPLKTWSVQQMADEISSPRNPPSISRNVRATYNWDNSSDIPKIVVPGAPRQFNLIDGKDLSKDLNEYRAASKDANLEAMFTAVQILNTEFTLSKYDMACDLGTLSGLFNFCRLIGNDIQRRSGKKTISQLNGFNSKNLRINMEKIGNTLLLVGEKPEFKRAGGIGPAFRRDYSRPPLSMKASMINSGSNLKLSLFQKAIYRMVSEIGFGDLKLLLADEVDAVEYPEQLDEADGLDMAKTRTDQLHDTGISITFGGYKGNPNSMRPIAFVSRSVKSLQRHSMSAQKWMNQYLCGVHNRYVGIHQDGKIEEAPQMRSMDEIRQMCGLNEETSALWATVLGQVIRKIIDFVRLVDETNYLAIIIDVDSMQMKIFEYEPGKPRVKAVSTKTMEYLNLE